MKTKDRLDRIEEHLGINKPTATRILIIQDKSGSMYSRRDETISGFNEYVESLQRDDSDEAFLTLIQFDTRYQVVEESKPVKDVKSLTRETYAPNGGTALLDAVGKGLNSLKKELKKGERALVVIMTDGMENSSSEYSRDAIKKMISDLEEKGNYTFIFMGAGTDSWSGGELLGLRRTQTVWYGQDSFSHGVGYRGLAATTSGLRSGTSMSNSEIGTMTSEAMSELGADVELEQEKSSKDSDDQSGE